MAIIHETSRHQVIIKLSGDVGIDDALIFHSTLVKCVSQSKKIVIDLSNITKIHLANIQIILALSKTAVAQKNHIELKGIHRKQTWKFFHDLGIYEVGGLA